MAELAVAVIPDSANNIRVTVFHGGGAAGLAKTHGSLIGCYAAYDAAEALLNGIADAQEGNHTENNGPKQLHTASNMLGGGRLAQDYFR
jgi:hypothetical protein